MTISYEEYLEHRNRDWSADPVYRFTSAMLKAAEVPGKPWRSDPRKVKAFIALYEIVREQMPDCGSEDIQAETQRLWEALPARQRAQLASKPSAIQRKLKQMIEAGK